MIGALATIAAAAISSPLVNSMYQDRPIVDISLGDKIDYPKTNLQSLNGKYFVEIIVSNRGKSDGKTTLNVIGNNATVSFNEKGPYQINQFHDLTIYPDPSKRTVKVYVSPQSSSESFSILLVAEHNNKQSYFQELNPYSPTQLTYQKTTNGYELMDSR